MRRLKQMMVLAQSAMLVLALWPTGPVSAYAAGKQDKGTSATEASADTITVTFKNGDGTSSKTTVELSNNDELGNYGTLQKPKDPTRDSKDGIRYEFDKWLFDDGTDAFGNQDSIQVGGTKNITLTAQWTEYLAKGYQIRAIYEDDFQILSDYTKPIQDQVKGATEYTMEPYEGVTTKGESAKGTKGTRNSNAIALIGQDGYAALSEAVAAASDGDTIDLQQDYALPSALIINKNITLDLNGHTLTCACKRDLKKRIEVASSAEVTITGGSDAASPGAIVNGEVLTAEDESGSSMIKSEGNLTFENVSITSGDTCVWAKAGVLNIDDGVTITSTYSSAVATNGAASGSATYSNGAVIHINGGTITSTNSIAVYVPAGTFYITGGNITGATGVYMKGGILSITGGTITGAGEDTAYVYLVGDAKPTGDALVIDVCGYPFGADPAISVTGGTFTSEHADAVGSYAADGYTAKAGFLSGGEYSSEPSSSYLAEGFSLVQNASGKWTIDHDHDFNFATQTPTWSWRRVNEAWSAASIYTCECGATEEVAASTAESTSAGTKTITATDTYDHTNSRTEELSYVVTYGSQAKSCSWGDLVTFEADGPRAWSINSQKVADGRASYTFAVTEDSTVTTANTDEGQPTAVINATLKAAGSGEATYNVKWSLPLGAKVESAKIYRGHTDDSETISADTIIAKGSAHNTGLLVRNGDYTLNLTGLSANKHQHVVTRIVYTVYGQEFELVSDPCSLANS